MAERWVAVAPLAELANCSRAVFEVEDRFIAIYRVGPALYAIEDQCSHDGASLDGGEVEGDEVICPRHGARFCLRTGAALTPPAYAPIAVFALREAEGQLWLNLG